MSDHKDTSFFSAVSDVWGAYEAYMDMRPDDAERLRTKYKADYDAAREGDGTVWGQFSNDPTKDDIAADLSSTHSIPFREDASAEPPELKGRDTDMTEIEQYRGLILDNIEYDLLRQDAGSNADDLDEIVEIIVETVRARRKYTRVSGSTFPHEVVKTRLLKLNSEHIRFVMQYMRENTTKIRNIKQYLLAVLFNAPTTMGNYYTAQVNHDLYGGS